MQRPRSVVNLQHAPFKSIRKFPKCIRVRLKSLGKTKTKASPKYLCDSHMQANVLAEPDSLLRQGNLGRKEKSYKLVPSLQSKSPRISRNNYNLFLRKVLSPVKCVTRKIKITFPFFQENESIDRSNKTSDEKSNNAFHKVIRVSLKRSKNFDVILQTKLKNLHTI